MSKDKTRIQSQYQGKNVQILSNKDMLPNKLAKTQQTKFRTCEVINNDEKNKKLKEEKTRNIIV